MKNIIIWMFVPVMMFVLIVPSGASAYTQPYYNQNQAQINYLYTLIAQLQAQLNAISGTTGYPTYPNTNDNSTATNYVSVQTVGVTASNREKIELEGQITFKRDGDARVWFEYAQTKSLNYSSISYEIKNKDNGDRFNFAISIPDLQTNRVYYYRAVAEGEDGRYAEGAIKSFRYEGKYDNNDDEDYNDDETPDVTTYSADNVDDNRAVLRGAVDMNDFDNGIAFFVYGEDEDQIDEAADESTYRSIDINGNKLRKVQVDSNLDNNRSFRLTVSGLNDNTDHYFRMCVQYEDEDGDDTLECGDVESFETDRN